MLSQLKSLVASAVTQDPIYEYRVDDKSMMLCGRQAVFRVKSAVEVSSGKEVSIFQVKIADLMMRQEPAADTTFFLDRVRRHVALLSQLRHPGILRIERGVVEAPGKKLWFVTERVKAWLPNVLTAGTPRQVRVLGLRRCAETVRFLHESADVMLVDFSPQGLFVTADGRWKLGDFVHAIRRAELMAESDTGVLSVLRPPSGSFRSVGAPMLDYVAAEFVDFLARSGARSGGSSSAQPQRAAAGGPSLAAYTEADSRKDCFGLPQQGAAEPSAPLSFAESDVYSFLLVAVEVLNGGRKLFNCEGSVDRCRAMRKAVEEEVERFFPRGALTYRPRPPMSTVLRTGVFTTPDMQLLEQVERYDMLDSEGRFRLLKALYTALRSSSSAGGADGGLNAFHADGLTQRGGQTGEAVRNDGCFCEAVIVTEILPLIKRESKQSMLRFVVPIVLQCCYVLSPSAFEEHLREYLSALLSAMTQATPPWYEKVGLLAQLFLERFDILCERMHRASDKTQILFPFLLKCLHTDGNSGDTEALLSLTLRALQRQLDTGGDAAVATLFPTGDTAATGAGRLIDIGSSHPTLFTTAFLCLDRILPVASLATKEAAETHLIHALQHRGTHAGQGVAHATLPLSAETQQLQRRSVMSTLQTLERGFSPEHIAIKSIPQLSSLLLSADADTQSFAVRSIDSHLHHFRAASDSGHSSVPVASLPPAAPASQRSTATQDFFLSPNDLSNPGSTNPRRNTNPGYVPSASAPPLAPVWTPAPSTGTASIGFAAPAPGPSPTVSHNRSSRGGDAPPGQQRQQTHDDIFASLGLS